MKTGIFCLGAMVGLAAAVPHQHRHHENAHKRAVVYETDYVTASAPDVYVYVDQNGNTLYTSYPGSTTPTAAPVPVGYSSSAAPPPPPPAPTSSYAPPPPPPPPASSHAPAPAHSHAPPPPPPSGGHGGSSGGYGISYSPYGGSYEANNVGCKTADQVNSDFAQIDGYSVVRIYGTDCSQVTNVLSAATKKGMKVFAGVFDINDVASEIQIIIDAVNGNWDSIVAVSVGNEVVNSGTASVSQVVSAVNQARGLLRGAGYNGPVVAVDTFLAIINNPEICQASDFAAANAHSYFAGNIAASGAGEWVALQHGLVSAACGGKTTWITETGWPSSGDSNSMAVAGLSQQSEAIASIKAKLTSNVILFTAFNDLWKAPGNLLIEQSWGILN